MLPIGSLEKANARRNCKSNWVCGPPPTYRSIGIVGRLAAQKGWSLILPVMKSWLERNENVQWAILGTGDPSYHEVLEAFGRSYPDRVAARLEFSNALAHQIEAGSDLFLMPSQYEPCGLNQMYSMAYGTVPVVRCTGGLADTVVDYDQSTIQNMTATGFRFNDFTAEALERCLSKAIRVYRDDKEVWNQMVQTGMESDWSWQAQRQEIRTALSTSDFEKETRSPNGIVVEILRMCQFE